MRNCYLIVLLCSCFISNIVAQTVDEDAFLLELVAQQSRDLHRDTVVVGDSVMVVCGTIWQPYPHPLCIPLMYVPPTIRSLTDTTSEDRYSIANIRRNALRYITRNHANLYVAVSDPNRLKSVEIGTTKVQRAIVKDMEEDKLDAARAIRDASSPWKREANLSLQMTQNYATENWHQGAANAFSLLSHMVEIKSFEKVYFTGTEESGHTWNAIYLDGAWYNVDATEAHFSATQEIPWRKTVRIHFGFSDTYQRYLPSFSSIIPACENDFFPVSFSIQTLINLRY